MACVDLFTVWRIECPFCEWDVKAWSESAPLGRFVDHVYAEHPAACLEGHMPRAEQCVWAFHVVRDEPPKLQERDLAECSGSWRPLVHTGT